MPTRPRARRPRRRAFTLVELLTVVAVLSVLAALLVPVAGRVRGRAHAIRCVSDLRQVGTATLLYVNENSGRLPSTGHARSPDGTPLGWTHTLAAHLGPGFLGRCPAAPDHPARITYGWNDLLAGPGGAGLPLTACRQPSSTLLVAELADDGLSEHLHFSGAARGRVTASFFRSLVAVERHGASANYLFVDGHVESLLWGAVVDRLAPAHPPFLYP